MLARLIPEVMSIEPPASAHQIESLAVALGLELPWEYRELLAQTNGVYANLVQMYPAEDVPERNSTYEVASRLPGYFVIGSNDSFPVLLRAGKQSPVFSNDWTMSREILRQVAPDLEQWVLSGCPDGRGDAAAD